MLIPEKVIQVIEEIIPFNCCIEILKVISRYFNVIYLLSTCSKFKLFDKITQLI